MTQIKAIDTYYNGRMYRSRLEARWAVFLDACGVSFDYEAEGYDLGDAGWYLPDFKIGDNWYLEIKPEIHKKASVGYSKYDVHLLWDNITLEAATKADALAQALKAHVTIIVGEPRIEISDNADVLFDYTQKFEAVSYYGCWSALPLDDVFTHQHICSLAEFLNDKGYDVSWFDGSYQDIRRLLDLDRDYCRKSHDTIHAGWGYCGVTRRYRWLIPGANYLYDTDLNNNVHSATQLAPFFTASTARFEHGATPNGVTP